MQKITDFIVEKRLLIFILMLILTIASFFMVKYTDINYDIMEYLPKTSNVRIGLDIMNANFKEEVSTLNVMVKDLDEEDKSKALKYLESIKNVSLEYENNKNFNKDNYTLFTLNLDYASSSKEAKKIYQDVTTYFKENLVDTSGTVSDENKVVLPFYIVVIAVLSALVILIIASSSYTEPFLFLFAILVAVFLNKGTNFIFGSVSNITNSIAAILQMALSMDYSIMLMNRYRQEREGEEDKVKAMKKALYHSFKSISSSSVTTIVGLLALVFMSFTIGKDLGFVLAKGVLFSLVSIFTILPFLILLFDKLIFKWKKKCPIFKLHFLGRFAYKVRYVGIILFVIILVGSFLLKGNLGILYTSSEVSEIEKVFPLNNQIVLIYDKDMEDDITNICNSVKDNPYIKDALCYGNTINEKIAYQDLNPKLKELETDTEVEDYLTKIVYYHYFNPEENNKINLDTLLDFIKSKVYKNEEMNNHISKSMKNDINTLKNFTNEKNIKQKRSKDEITKTLNIKSAVYDDLMVLYNVKDNNTYLTLNSFANYMEDKVLTKEKYASLFDEDTKEEINLLAKYSDGNVINESLSYQKMASTLGISKEVAHNVYLYYLNEEIPTYQLSISSLVNFMLNNEVVKESLNSEEIANLNLVKNLSDETLITKKMTNEELGAFFGMDAKTIELFMGNMELHTPYEFVSTIMGGNYKNFLDKATLANTIMESSINNKTYQYDEMSKVLNIEKSSLRNVYVLYFEDTVYLTPYEFVSLITSSDTLVSKVDKDTLDNLNLLLNIMESSRKNQTFSGHEMAEFLNVKEDDINLIYALYKSEKEKVSLSYQEFISFLLNDVLNSKYADTLSSDSVKKLKIVDKIITNSLNKRVYTSKELYNLLSPLSKDLDKDLIDLVYIYYGSEKQYSDDYKMTVEEFIHYLKTDILEDKRFDDYIKEDLKEDIIEGDKKIGDAKISLVSSKYHRALLNTYLEPESKDTFAFIKDIDKKLEGKGEYYLVGDSPMALEMTHTFSGELNLITILTMAFIFVVVAFTFKSLKISTMLVLLIQSAIFLIMGILSFSGSVYFISILIVQSILMGATIDYAILYTSYYLEERKTQDIEVSLTNAYNDSMHTILTSASILIIVTLIVGNFASEVAAKICKTLSEGTICASILIIFLLPPMLASLDKFINKKKKNSKKVS